MIYPFVGDFLLSPIPLQLSFNWCSHACSYCFANLNSPSRSFDLKEFQTQLKGIYTNNSLPSQLLREKYPVLISNLVDPFATSNYGVAVPVIEMLTQQEIPVAIQTRGGRGVDDVLAFLPRSVWYISIPMLNDDIRRKLEPAAPTIASRLELIEKVKAAGHEVVVGLNPTIKDWLPGDDATTLVDIFKSMGVHGIWIAGLHLNNRQMRVMPDKDKERIGENLIQTALKDARSMSKETYEFLNEIKEYALSNNIEVEGINDGKKNHFFTPFYSVYEKAFPTIYNFINWCHETKKHNEPVYYKEFEDHLLKGLIGGAHNVSPYMRCMSKKLDDQVRSTLGYKQTFRWLLNLCWNDRRMNRNMNRYWHFTLGVISDGNDLKLYEDEDENLIYFYNKELHNEEYFIVNN